MTGADREQPQGGAGERFADTVSIDFCDFEHDLFGLVWITRLPNAGRTRASALVFAEGALVETLELELEQVSEDWQLARVDGISIATLTPLEQWSVEVSGSGASLSLDAAAASSAVELHAGVADSTGISQYEQLCRLSGVVTVGRHAYPVSCTGRRVHSWGDFAWDEIDRWRTLYAASDSGRAISVAAARPAGATGHGDELRAASLIAAEEIQPFEDVRISTVWAAGGWPAKAGLELGMPGDEIPRRMGGEAIVGTRTERDGHSVTLSFFRWSLEGILACGVYEVAERR
jgi:hypothetical protein